jgi:hypothetical protein
MVEHTFDVVIVGGGPAGMAAAVCAAESNRRVALVDDNPAAGGQIWRRQQQNPGNGSAGEWFNRFKKAQVELFFGAQVVGHPNGGVLVAESFSDTHVIRYDKLVLAPGARERFLPFPGWTLPNVMGAGGLQALVKSGLPIRGKRVVVAGSGPLLLAVAAYLKKQGADVRLIAEQTPWLRLARFALSLWKHPAKLTQSLQLARELFGVRFVASCWPLSAQGNERLSGVALQTPSRRWTEPGTGYPAWMQSGKTGRGCKPVAGKLGKKCFLRRRSDRDWWCGIGSRRRPDCRLCSRKTPGGCAATLSPAAKVAAFCPRSAGDLHSSNGAEVPPFI